MPRVEAKYSEKLAKLSIELTAFWSTDEFVDPESVTRADTKIREHTLASAGRRRGAPRRIR